MHIAVLPSSIPIPSAATFKQEIAEFIMDDDLKPIAVVEGKYSFEYSLSILGSPHHPALICFLTDATTVMAESYQGVDGFDTAALSATPVYLDSIRRFYVKFKAVRNFFSVSN